MASTRSTQRTQRRQPASSTDSPRARSQRSSVTARACRSPAAPQRRTSIAGWAHAVDRFAQAVGRRAAASCRRRDRLAPSSIAVPAHGDERRTCASSPRCRARPPTTSTRGSRARPDQHTRRIAMKHWIQAAHCVRRRRRSRRVGRGGARARRRRSAGGANVKIAKTRARDASSSTARGSRLYDFVQGQGHDERVLRRVRRALAAADHERQAGRRARRPRVAARHDQAEGRQARGHLRRPPALLLRHRPQARPDDRPGRQPVRRPVVGPLGRGQGDPPWLAVHTPRTNRRRPVRSRRSTGSRHWTTAGRRRGRALPRRSLDRSRRSQFTPSSTTTRTSPSCRRSARCSCSASSASGVVGSRADRAGAAVRPEHRRLASSSLAALGAIGIALGIAREPADQRVHAAVRIHGVRLPARDRADAGVRRLTTVFLGAFVAIVAPQLVKTIATKRRLR